MYATIERGDTQIIVLDLVKGHEGFLFLRVVGPEVAVNALWAGLVAKRPATLTVKSPGDKYGSYASPERFVKYKTFRSQLPSGMVDLAMIHPSLTVTEDNPDGFSILAYEDGVPSGFFERLNKTLSIPLKPEWESWLWEMGRKSVSWEGIRTREVWENRQPVEKSEVHTFTETPVRLVRSEVGDVLCYRVSTSDVMRQAWLEIIRQKLGLGIRLGPLMGGYFNGVWNVTGSDGEWVLRHQNEGEVLKAGGLEFLLAQARDKKGLHLVIEGEY